ncbi:MAG: hypothetical protein Q4A00_07650 [Flavobacteriaceae bacterium]|nr:hypothetical protein [Flavobacteriaceae bacterium]
MNFKELLKHEGLTAQQIKHIELLDKKFSATNASNLKKANDLLFSLLYTNNLSAVQTLLDLMTQIPFNGNFNQWTFVEPSYTLRYFLSNDNTEKEKIKHYLINEVRSEWDDDEEHAEHLQKKRDGMLVESSLEQLERYNTSEKEEFTWRTTVLIRYLEVLTIGATGKLDEKNVLNEINSNIERQKALNAKFSK